MCHLGLDQLQKQAKALPHAVLALVGLSACLCVLLALPPTYDQPHVLDDLAAEVNEGEGHVLQARVGRLVEIHAFVPGKADEPFGMQKAWAV